MEDFSLKIIVQINIFRSCSQTNCDLWGAPDKPVKLRKSVFNSGYSEIAILAHLGRRSSEAAWCREDNCTETCLSPDPCGRQRGHPAQPREYCTC